MLVVASAGLASCTWTDPKVSYFPLPSKDREVLHSESQSLHTAPDERLSAPPRAMVSGDSFDPPSYVVYRTLGPIDVDGRLDEADWAAAPWTADFVDIEGRDRPSPRFRTRAKMLWDDEALYVAAWLEEPDVWATLTERDARIYQDNAFEVFIDPDGDTHNYYEIEINASETVWDLIIIKPFRDGGPSLSAWDIRGLEVSVQVDGTLNDPTDTDKGWTVEMALPWAVLKEAAPGRRPPREGEQWRLNFARSQWSADVVDGAYRKNLDTAADWWVWSPQGAVDMHRPERFGYVQFADAAAGQATVPFVEAPDERIKRALRQLYYRQRDYRDAHGRYAEDLAELHAGDFLVEGVALEAELRTTPTSYEITAPAAEGTTVHIRHDGKVWATDRKIPSKEK
jgi:hypothetical protein